MKTLLAILLCFVVALPASAQRFVKVVGTTNELMAQPVPDIHSVTLLKGYASSNENLNAFFQYIRASAATPNGISIFTPTFGGGVGRYHRLLSEQIQQTNFTLIVTNVTVIVSSNLTFITTNLTFITTNTTNFGWTFINASTTNTFFTTNLFLLSTSNLIAHADTVADLVTLPTTIQYVTLGGYTARGDGGGGDFVLTNSIVNTNLGTRIASSTAGYSWDRVYSGPLDVVMFGADKTGVTDSATNFQSAVYASTNAGNGISIALGSDVFIPRGTYNIQKPIQLVNGIQFLGSGRHTTVLNSGTTNDMLVLNANFVPLLGETPSFRIGRFSINGTNNTAGIGVWFSTNANVLAQYQGVVEDMQIFGMKHAIRGNGVLLSSIDNVTSWEAANHAFYFGNPFNATTFKSTFSVGANGDGFNVLGNYISWINCGSDANEGSGYGTEGGYTMSWISCGSEGNWIHGFGLTNVVGATIISPYVVAGTTGGGVPSSKDGIHIEGGSASTISIIEPVIQAQNANHTGYAINVTTSAGIYPDQVVVTGGQIAVLTAGRFNDVGNKITRLNNNLGIGVAVPTQQLDVRNSANIGANLTAAASTAGLAFQQIYILPTSTASTNQINLLDNLGNRRLDIMYIGATSGGAQYGVPIGEVGINAALSPLNLNVADVMKVRISSTGSRFVDGITNDALTASSILRSDANKRLAMVTVGSGLSFDGTTLASTVSGGVGTVTSVALTVPGVFSVAGSPVTGSGTLAVSAVDPGADRLVGFDNTDNDIRYMVIGAGLNYDAATDTLTSTAVGTGGGDFIGPASATDSALVLFDTTTGKLGKNSVVTLTSLGWMNGVTNLTVSSRITNATLTANALVSADANKALKSVTIGANLTFDGTTLAAAGAGTGDFVGPSGATDEALVRFDTGTGKLGQNSVALLTDAGALSVAALTVSGGITNIQLTANRLVLTDSNQRLSSLADPNANRIIVWDDTDNLIRNAVLGVGLVYTPATDTLSVTNDPISSGTDFSAVKILTQGSEVSVFEIAMPSNSSVAIQVEWSVESTDGVDFETNTGVDFIAGGSKAGFIGSNFARSISSGFYLTHAGPPPTFDGDANDLSAGKIIYTQTFSSTQLTPTSITFRYRVKNFGGKVITQL